MTGTMPTHCASSPPSGAPRRPMPDAEVQHPGQVLDIIMLAVTGGRERSEADYRALLARGGWALERVVPTASPLSLVEAVPS